MSRAVSALLSASQLGSREVTSNYAFERSEKRSS